MNCSFNHCSVFALYQHFHQVTIKWVFDETCQVSMQSKRNDNLTDRLLFVWKQRHNKIPYVSMCASYMHVVTLLPIYSLSSRATKHCNTIFNISSQLKRFIVVVDSVRLVVCCTLYQPVHQKVFGARELCPCRFFPLLLLLFTSI